MLIPLVLIVHTLVAAALVGVILLQRSEGGGLGIGGGTGGGLVSARGAADLMTRSTSVLAGLFVLTSLGLAILYSAEGKTRRIDTGAARAPVSASTTPVAPPAPTQAPFAGLGASLPGAAGPAQPTPADANSPASPPPAAPLAK